jgi:transcriptional regulator GlxA family with amidase domain
MLGAVRKGFEPLAVEEVALDMLAGLISATSRCGTTLRRANRQTATLRRHEQLVSAVKEELARRLGEKLCLESIAETVHVSPFHLSRVFRSTTGISLSSYHRRLRLRTALQRILDGENDLTRLAVELGFSHHSHFSSAFGSEFGIPPSANRDQLKATDLRNAATAFRSRAIAMNGKQTI